ncbi:MAG: four helix bundle protein [Cyclobacteriaceae bacterium]
MGQTNILKSKSYSFAVLIIKLHKSIREQHKEYDLTRQLLRSGTAIGALIREAEFGQSKADFISKLSISLKEANETDYWLELLKDTEFISKNQYIELRDQCKQLIKMLVSSIKTAKTNR